MRACSGLIIYMKMQIGETLDRLAIPGQLFPLFLYRVGDVPNWFLKNFPNAA